MKAKEILKEVPEAKDWVVAKVIGKDGEYIMAVNLRTGLLRIRGLGGKLLTSEELMKPYGMDIPITVLRMDWVACDPPTAFVTKDTVGPEGEPTTLRDKPKGLFRWWHEWAYQVGLTNKAPK